MQLETTLIRKSFVALTTLERFVLSVDGQVLHVVALLDESLTAHST